MTFLELMQLLSFSSPSFGAVVYGWRLAGGFGILIGILVGLAAGLVCYGGTRAFAKWVNRHPKLGSADARAAWTVLAYALCVGLFAWIIALTFLGAELTTGLLQSRLAP